jgi:hypothetical protein
MGMGKVSIQSQSLLAFTNALDCSVRYHLDVAENQMGHGVV